LEFLKVAKKSEVHLGKMIHVEIHGKEIMIANVDGKFYAINDRCGHMNVRLSMGTLTNTVVTCPAHFARFDVTTGKLISEPKMMESGTANIFEKCPEEAQKTIMQMMRHQVELQKPIKTYNMPVYSLKIDGDDILVNA
jgi:nitrite reductase/ring-hydroxylating ferredoxin subunit